VTQAVVLPSKHEALISNPSSAKKKKKILPLLNTEIKFYGISDNKKYLFYY
jgi:hypothetical protein